MRIYIIHGAFGNPKENWFPWLKKELEELNETVIVPSFPTPAGQNLENWLKVFKQYELTPTTVFVAHSLGAAFVLSLLEQAEVKIKACYFYA